MGRLVGCIVGLVACCASVVACTPPERTLDAQPASIRRGAGEADRSFVAAGNGAVVGSLLVISAAGPVRAQDAENGAVAFFPPAHLDATWEASGFVVSPPTARLDAGGRTWNLRLRGASWDGTLETLRFGFDSLDPVPPPTGALGPAVVTVADPGAAKICATRLVDRDAGTTTDATVTVTSLATSAPPCSDVQRALRERWPAILAGGALPLAGDRPECRTRALGSVALGIPISVECLGTEGALNLALRPSP